MPIRYRVRLLAYRGIHFYCLYRCPPCLLVHRPLETTKSNNRNNRIIEIDAFQDDPCSETEMISGLRFLFENYKHRSWYWELRPILTDYLSEMFTTLCTGHSLLIVSALLLQLIAYLIFRCFQSSLAFLTLTLFFQAVPSTEVIEPCGMR